MKISSRLIWAFLVLSLASLAVFFLTLSRDWTREWHRYQKEYGRRLVAMTKGSTHEVAVEAPLHQFQQIIVADGRRVDRCTTCHLAVEDPRFKNVPQPLRTHPHIGPHPFEKFGCTVCHGGIGRATETQSAHEGLTVMEGRLLPSGRIEYQEERHHPLWRKEFIQAACGSCHARQRLKEARLLSLGKSLFRAKGCMGCHKIGGIGGKIGPDLTLVGGRRSDPEWYLAHFKSPEEVSPGSAMPSYKNLSLPWRKALTVFMLSLRRVPSSLLPGIPIEEKEVRALVTPPVDRGHWEAPESAASLKNPFAPTPKHLAEGQKLYTGRCSSCHGEKGDGNGKGAPDLKPHPANFTMGHTAEHPEGTLFWKIKHGRGLMPGWGGTLSDRQVWLLVSYIRKFARKGMIMPGMKHDDEHRESGDGHKSMGH